MEILAIYYIYSVKEKIVLDIKNRLVLMKNGVET